jgi:Tol biopolymer transport system component
VATGLVTESQLIAPDLGNYGLWRVFSLSVSPDQRYIAINTRTWEGSGFILWIISTDGHRATQVGIPEHEFETVFLDWIPGVDGMLLRSGLGHAVGTARIEDDSFRALPLHMIADGAVSPDGQRVAISTIEEKAFWFMNVNGTGIEKVSIPDKAPGGAAPNDITWSPDGKWIAYVDHFASEMQQIRVITVDGKNPKHLSSSDAHNVSPVWSPDGMTLAYVREESKGIIRDEPNTWTSSIWLVDVASGTSRELVQSEGKSHWAPTWLPDGSAILFISNRGGADDIWIINADGTGLQQLTFHGYVTGGLAVIR